MRLRDTDEGPRSNNIVVVNAIEYIVHFLGWDFSLWTFGYLLMGNCCSGGKDTRTTNTRAFHGQGHRLGSSNERLNYGTGNPRSDAVETPKPVVNPNLDEEARREIRAERAAAAEKRLNVAGKKKNPKKKKDASPLRGPNSQRLMQWSVG